MCSMNTSAADNEIATNSRNENRPQLIRAALNALPEALFLFDARAGTIDPINTPAWRWVAKSDATPSAISVSHVFPELGAATISQAGADAIVPLRVRAIDRETFMQHDVELQLFALGDEVAKFIVAARAVGNSHPADDFAVRDALDDAFHDPLTRLANRRLFQRRLERAIDRAGRSSYHFAVLFVDLDRFKDVNDHFGHLQGDRVLVAAAQRLVEAVRPQDMVARRDGDEFTILLDDLERPEDAVHVAERIIERLQASLSTDGPTATAVNVEASIGIVMASDGALSADELVARADAAMYHAKALGGSTFVTLDRGAAASSPEGSPNPREKPLPR